MLTRRKLLCSLIPLMAAARRRVGAEPLPTGYVVSLAKEFPQSILKAVSPDGTKVCIEDWTNPGYPILIVETGTWRVLRTARLRSRILSTSFFADSRGLYLEGLAKLTDRHFGRQEAVLELDSGEFKDMIDTLPDPFAVTESLYATDGRGLVVARYRMKPYRMDSISRMELPNNTERGQVRMESGPTSVKPSPGLSFSSDRSRLAYMFDGSVVCRRAEDLSVIWARQIEQGLRPQKLVLSANGNLVAAAISNSSFIEQQRKSYIVIYDGEEGRDLERFQINGANGIALSPDGRVIAVIENVAGKDGQLSPTVHIYEISSGKRLTSFEHDRIPSGRRQFLQAGCNVEFTSDGKYLITSGMTTKVWLLGAEN